ncbi:MAG: hypothetical protein AAGH15_02970 [Myxococcota bacterium]
MAEGLPLPVDALPASLRRFADPNAPTPAKVMAARGMVPVRGADQIILLTQLAADADATVADTASKSLEELPDPVLLPALSAELPGAIAAALAERFPKRDEVLEVLVQNAALPDVALERVARTCSERISELISVNQQRLLGAPKIVEALYRNRNTRMSTADRLVELCARNGVRLDGIPAFDIHVEAIQGQLIIEPTLEALPTDEAFKEAVEMDDGEDAVEFDKVEQTEELKEKFKPLSFRIADMTTAEKVRLAVVGDAAARSILVRDPLKQVSQAAISSPAMREQEAVAIAHSKEVGEHILRYIGGKKQWLASYELKKALLFNPKTPVGISMRFMAHLRANDLRMLSKNKNVPGALRRNAKQRMELREKKTTRGKK